MDQKSLIEKELLHTGQPSAVTPVLLNLDGCRIATDTEVPAEEFLMRFFGKPCFPRRDISTVTGQEKCGKTFFTSMLMACCAQRNVLELERIREEPLRVMWYDTEQSRHSTKDILTGRIARMAPADGALDTHFFVFNVRACTCQQRMDYLVAGIEAYHPDMVIIDNVSDLLPSINDGEESQRVIDQLMQLATTANCNITVVIHLNRSGDKRNLRGWLGTEILHKSFEVYYCEQLLDTDVFSVEQTLTRKYRIPETLYYRISDEGLPEVTAKPCVQSRDAAGRFMSNKPEAYHVSSEKVESFNQSYIIRNDGNARTPWEWDLRRLFDDAMADRALLSCDMLRQEVMRLSGIRQPKYYDKVFKLAVEQRVVQTTLDRNGRVVVVAAPS